MEHGGRSYKWETTRRMYVVDLSYMDRDLWRRERKVMCKL